MQQSPKTENIAAQLMPEVGRVAAAIAGSNPDVVGILLTGGLARGFADHFSDIDIEVFFPNEDRAKPTASKGLDNHCLPQGNFIEFTRHNFKEWMNPRNEPRIWTMANRWDKSNARILHDPEGKIARMLQIKLVFRRDERRRLQSQARNNSIWLAKGVANSWAKRGDLAAAHHAVNCGIDLLLDYLFLKNGRFIPHAKWKLFLGQQLPTLPQQFAERIGEALLVKELTPDDLSRRQAVFVPLVKESQRLPNQHCVCRTRHGEQA